ncbi:MAG: S-layer protein [Candidatus Woesearchaeota archaeon]
MKNGKKIKKLVALGTGALMVGASLFGAMAAGLSDLPSPFVKADGSFDGFIVVGADAKTGDVLGAIDIATAFQARAVKKEVVSVEGTSKTEVSVDDGVLLWSTTKHLTLDKNLDGRRSTLREAQWDVLKEREMRSDTGSKKVKYTQSIALPSGVAVAYGRPEYSDLLPILHYDITNKEFTYTVSFESGSWNFSEFKNAELVLFGKTFYVTDATYNSSSSLTKLVLSGAADEVTMKVGDKQTVGGKSVELIGANENTKDVSLRINGRLYSAKEGDNIELTDGDTVYVRKVILYTIPEKSVYVELSVGSKKMEFETGKVTINGKSYGASNGIDVTLQDDKLTVKIKPSAFSTDFGGVFKYWREGSEWTDPIFGLKWRFEGTTPNYKVTENKVPIRLVRDGDSYVIFRGVRADDKEVEIKLFESDNASQVKVYNESNYKLVLQGNLTNVEVGTVFIYNDADYGDYPLTRVFMLDNIYDATGTDKDRIRLIDLTTNEYIEKEDTNGNCIELISDKVWGKVNSSTLVDFYSNSVCNASYNLAASSDFYAKGGFKITFEIASNNGKITLNENTATDIKDEVTSLIQGQVISVTADSTKKISMDLVSTGGIIALVKERDGDWKYGVSNLGTFFKADDKDKDEVYIYLPQEEAKVVVAVGTEDMKINYGAAATSGSVETQTVKPIKLGAAVLDTEVLGQVGRANMISVGGPAVNRVSAELMGLTYPTYGTASGIPKDSGLIKMFKTGSKVGIVVAGWEEEQSRMAARVLAEYLVSGKYASDLKDKEEVVVTGSRDNIKVTTPQ